MIIFDPKPVSPGAMAYPIRLATDSAGSIAASPPMPSYAPMLAEGLLHELQQIRQGLCPYYLVA
jgi:hypothetical protein